MRPLDDDPQLYRENVYKSWLIMSFVVRHIKNQCYVAHSDAPVGVGYDNLVLVKVYPSGATQFGFAMNRNGVNSTVVQYIWEKVDEIGAEEVAKIIIARCELEVSSDPVDSEATQLCDEVVEWLEQHKDDEGFFEPIQIMPNGKCVSAIFRESRVSELLSPMKLGKNEKKDGDMAKKQNSKEEVPQSMTLQGALENWGKLNDRRHVWKEIEAIIEKLESKGGSKAVAFHTTPSKAYVGVKFAHDLLVIGAFIQVGFVDHLEFLEGSEWSDERKNYRTLLTPSNKS
jgi:hypothetical protein